MEASHSSLMGREYLRLIFVGEEGGDSNAFPTAIDEPIGELVKAREPERLDDVRFHRSQPIRVEGAATPQITCWSFSRPRLQKTTR